MFNITVYFKDGEVDLFENVTSYSPENGYLRMARQIEKRKPPIMGYYATHTIDYFEVEIVPHST